MSWALLLHETLEIMDAQKLVALATVAAVIVGFVVLYQVVLKLL